MESSDRFLNIHFATHTLKWENLLFGEDRKELCGRRWSNRQKHISSLGRFTEQTSSKLTTTKQEAWIFDSLSQVLLKLPHIQSLTVNALWMQRLWSIFLRFFLRFWGNKVIITQWETGLWTMQLHWKKHRPLKNCRDFFSGKSRLPRTCNYWAVLQWPNNMHYRKI